ncbi:hypothetical protein BC332_09631 [Capsicum chinense]|nr:hypothetical protein BC332_09631 [Capsicum chinense]
MSMMYNGKSRQIRQRHNIIRELLSSRVIGVDYVKSMDNVPDPLTKGISIEGVERTSMEMGLRPRTSQQSDVDTSGTRPVGADVAQKLLESAKRHLRPQIRRRSSTDWAQGRGCYCKGVFLLNQCILSERTH